jgi:3-oxoacyl-[acyl-carrier-protein] synthase II
MSGIVVTGLGLAVPVGLSVPDAWERAVRGASAIDRVRRFDPGDSSCATAEVPPFVLADRLRVPKNEKFMGTSVRLAMHAAHSAVAASQLDLAAVDPFRIALYTGSGQTGLDNAEFFGAYEIAWTGEVEKDYANLGGRASRALDRFWSLRTLANAGVGLLATELAATGASDNFVQGDTASAVAVAAGARELADLRCDVAIVGGYDSLLNVSDYLAYREAALLSAAPAGDAYRPFDERRDGLVLGEGAGFLVLERAADAARRGAPIVGELLGTGFAIESTNRLESKTSPAALRAAIEAALNGSTPDFVIAHGIGTREGDRSEATLIAELVGRDVPVTALKGLTGYLGAATGAVELVLALEAARRRVVPPIARHERRDPACDLALVAGRPLQLTPARPTGLCISWSWFGQCAAIAVRPWIGNGAVAPSVSH